jgi:hypothetical protein
VIIFRFDGPIVFANRDFLKQTLVGIIADKQAHRTSTGGSPHDDEGSTDPMDLQTAVAEV